MTFDINTKSDDYKLALIQVAEKFNKDKRWIKFFIENANQHGAILDVKPIIDLLGDDTMTLIINDDLGVDLLLRHADLPYLIESGLRMRKTIAISRLKILSILKVHKKPVLYWVRKTPWYKVVTRVHAVWLDDKSIVLRTPDGYVIEDGHEFKLKED